MQFDCILMWKSLHFVHDVILVQLLVFADSIVNLCFVIRMIRRCHRPMLRVFGRPTSSRVSKRPWLFTHHVGGEKLSCQMKGRCMVSEKKEMSGRRSISQSSSVIPPTAVHWHIWIAASAASAVQAGRSLWNVWNAQLESHQRKLLPSPIRAKAALSTVQPIFSHFSHNPIWYFYTLHCAELFSQLLQMQKSLYDYGWWRQ